MHSHKDISMVYIFQIADDFCGDTPVDLPGFGPLSQCVAINKCSKLLDNSNAPATQVLPCGFDQKQKLMKICCPPTHVTEIEVKISIKVFEATNPYFVGFKATPKIS